MSSRIITQSAEFWPIAGFGHLAYAMPGQCLIFDYTNKFWMVNIDHQLDWIEIMSGRVLPERVSS